MSDREQFEAFVLAELGDVAVMDHGRYISPKINNYWRTWQAAQRIENMPRLPPQDIGNDPPPAI